jgi:hypothetical protein
MIMMLGLDQSSNGVYETLGNIWFAIWPSPTISRAILDPKLPVSEPSFTADFVSIFREDSFDAITRVRRGRLYSWFRSDIVPTLPHPAYGDYGASEGPVSGGGFARRLLPQYNPYGGNRPKIVALGSPDSLWRVIGWERIITGEWLYTLKARNAFGILPELNPDAIPANGRAKAVELFDSLSDAAYRESPESIVHLARDVTQWFLAVWAASKVDGNIVLTDDIGEVLKKIRAVPKLAGNMFLQAVEIVRRFHSRAKPNEQERYESRPVVEDDAELALKAIAFLVREFKWAV